MESKRFFAKHPGEGQTKFKGLSKIFRGQKPFRGWISRFAKHPGEGQTKFKGLSKIFRGQKPFRGWISRFVVESQTLSQTSRLNLDKFGVDNYIPDFRSAPFALTIGPLA